MSITAHSNKMTCEQDAALNASLVSIALSAGAGCGKTLVLTERFLRHLDGEHAQVSDLNQLIAMTFTDKAARELRDRVRRACRQRLASRDRTESARWRSIVRGLEAAPIGTFHAFCGELLRRFPIEAGVEPGFAIAEESIAPGIRDEALASCIRTWLAEGDEDFFELAVNFGLPRLRTLLTSLILLRTRGDLGDWASRDPAEIVESWRALWTSQTLPDLLCHLVVLAKPRLELLTDGICSHPKMRQRIEFLRDAIPGLLEHPEPLAALEDIQKQAQVASVGKEHWESVEVYEHVKKSLDEFRKAIMAVRKTTWSEGVSLHAAEIACRLSRLAVRAIAACDRAKRDQGVLDFDDLLLRTQSILNDPPEPVRRWIENSVGYVLIDEFQDTDPIQGSIVRTLAGEGFRSGRLFLVGDSKQSIYRFRGARPQVFQDFRAEFPEAGRLQLTANFRSRPEILDFANALFADTFPGVEHLLRPGSGTPPPDGRTAIELLWAHEAPDVERTAKEKVPVHERRRIEARWIARHLRGRIEAGWPIRDGNTVRDAHAGDIVLLFRTLNDAASYESALVLEGLDYRMVGGSAFFGQQEVLDLINVLSAIEDPFDSLALAATMRSAFGCISDEGLYWLATSSHGDLARGLENWARIPGLTTDDRARAGRFHDLMMRWRLRKDHLPITDLVERAIDESGYEAAILAEFLGERKRANVRKLIRLARRYDVQGGLTLADFVARLRADFQDPPREDEAATTDEAGHAVRLMTVHQAKGLEFPIVVVPDLDRKPPAPTRPITFHPGLGPIVKPPEEDLAFEEVDTGESLGRLVLKGIESKEEQDESLCLFYVATTRARDALILSAGRAPDDPPTSTALKLLSRRFDLQTGDCRAVLPEGIPSPRIKVIATEPASNEARQPRAARYHPRLLSVARLITRARIEPEPSTPPRRQRPHLLDLEPALAMPPHAARVDRLMRSILSEPRGLDPRTLPALAHRLARIQNPAASRRIETEALALLSAWLETGTARALVAGAGEMVVRGRSWSTCRPADDSEPTVIHGRLDLAFREPRGGWTLAVLAHPAAPAGRERLRLQLAARAVGLDPINRLLFVDLGDPAGRIELPAALDDDAIEAAVLEASQVLIDQEMC